MKASEYIKNHFWDPEFYSPEADKKVAEQVNILESIAAALVKWDTDWPPYGPADKPDYTKEDQERCHQELRAIIVKAQEVVKPDGV